MVFRLFDNKILTTPKCGTRYLSKIWTSVYFNYNKFNKGDWNEFFNKNLVNTEYLIIREPIEHFKTALHTEFIYHTSLYDYNIDLKTYLDRLILLGENFHWSYNMYEVMYWIYIKNDKKIKIIHLSFLTDFIKKQGYNIEYTPSDYNFNDSENWINKDDFFNKLLKDFPIQLEILLKQINEQNIFYNKIINNATQTKSLI